MDKKKVISKKILEKYWSSSYEVKTVVPLVKDAYERITIMTKDELDEFCFNSKNYAEFIVEVKPLME